MQYRLVVFRLGPQIKQIAQSFIVYWGRPLMGDPPPSPFLDDKIQSHNENA